jgi:hypothetical protein
MSDFYKYFKENMDSLGLPAPEGLFGTAQAAIANCAIFVAHIDKFGTKITVRELIKAGTRLEKLGVVAAISASFYVGAVIGSIAVAAGRCLGNGTSLADVLFTANRSSLRRPWLTSTLQACPTLYGCGVKRQPR